jgi:hypothetical protein
MAMTAIPQLFFDHNERAACPAGAHCAEQATTTCHLRHWDYCVQYYLFSRCSCLAFHPYDMQNRPGHISREIYEALIAEAYFEQLHRSWIQGKAPTIELANARQQIQVWHDRVACAHDEQAKWRADIDTYQKRVLLEEHHKQCHVHEALVSKQTITEFLALTTRQLCPHVRVLPLDACQLIVNIPLERPPHNAKKLSNGYYRVCPACLCAFVDVRPQDLAFLIGGSNNIIPPHTMKYASESVLHYIRIICDRIDAYETFFKSQCTQELTHVGVCRDAASLVISFL